MKITTDWLRKKHACSEGRHWFESQSETDVAKVAEKLIEEDHLDWANWLLSRAFTTKRQRVQYAVFAAEQVLHLFEDRYPEDKRPRNAIGAAKRWLEDESAAAADADAYAYADAAYAAYAYAADAAAAADAYADAADADAAADAAYAAAAAADAADAAAKRETKVKILKFGIGLIREKVAA